MVVDGGPWRPVVCDGWAVQRYLGTWVLGMVLDCVDAGFVCVYVCVCA